MSVLKLATINASLVKHLICMKGGLYIHSRFALKTLNYTARESPRANTPTSKDPIFERFNAILCTR